MKSEYPRFNVGQWWKASLPLRTSEIKAAILAKIP